LLEVFLEEKRREIIKEWIGSRRSKEIQKLKNTIENPKNFIKNKGRFLV